PQAAAVATQHVGDRADVCAGGNEELEQRDAARVLPQLELAHERATAGHVHRGPAAGEPVGPLAADLHRRGGRDGQLDLAAQTVEPPLELGAARRLGLLDDLALGVAGRCACRQVDGGHVALVESDEVLGKPGRRAEQDEQQPSRKRVERPGVPRARARPLAQLPDDRERRGPGRLVDEHEPCRSERALHRGSRRPPTYADGEPSTWAAYAARMNAVIWAIDSLLEKPAACRCPPPPRCLAIADTSSSSLEERRLTRRGASGGSGGSRMIAAICAPSTARR